jgi:hypothetical protein
MEFTNPGLLGSAEKFRERFAVPIERHGSEEATQALQRMTQPFLLRRHDEPDRGRHRRDQPPRPSREQRCSGPAAATVAMR